MGCHFARVVTDYFLALSSLGRRCAVCGLLISTVHFVSKILQFYILILSQPAYLHLASCPCNFHFNMFILHENVPTFISFNAIHRFLIFIHRIEIEECQKSSELGLSFSHEIQFTIQNILPSLGGDVYQKVSSCVSARDSHIPLLVFQGRGQACNFLLHSSLIPL